jgi:D-alanine-D-alanine ligase
MKRLRVLVLVHPDLIPPESNKGYTEQEINDWKTEYDVVTTLRAAGHEVRPLGVHDELKPIRDDIEAWKPDVVFTLLEQFHGEAIYDQNVVSYLELLRVPYTGCNPRGLMLARGKDLSKTLVQYHRVPVPDFAVFPMHRKVKRPARLALPLIVKSVNEDASYGISQAPPRSPSNISKAGRSMSASSAMTACWCCRSGNCNSRTCRKAIG